MKQKDFIYLGNWRYKLMKTKLYWKLYKVAACWKNYKNKPMSKMILLVSSSFLYVNSSWMRNKYWESCSTNENFWQKISLIKYVASVKLKNLQGWKLWGFFSIKDDNDWVFIFRYWCSSHAHLIRRKQRSLCHQMVQLVGPVSHEAYMWRTSVRSQLLCLSNMW